MRQKAISAAMNTQLPELNLTAPSKRRAKEQRDPYDGLRFWSAATHGVGAVLALAGTVLLLARVISTGEIVSGVVFSIYGVSMFCLYLASTLYHCVNTTVPRRLALRKYDHCAIYLLIAGSYTPMCVLALGGRAGIALLSVIWGMALAGIVLTLVKLEIPRWLTSVIYLIMGWAAIFAIAPLSRAMPVAGMVWLLAGGILYSVGGILYAVKWPGRNNPRFGCHEIFHVFILLGSVCHFMLMYHVVALL